MIVNERPARLTRAIFVSLLMRQFNTTSSIHQRDKGKYAREQSVFYSAVLADVPCHLTNSEALLSDTPMDRAPAPVAPGFGRSWST